MWSVLAFLAACTPSDSADTGSDSGKVDDSEETADTGEAAETAETAETGDTTPPENGLVTWEGHAEVDGSYVGTEDILFEGELGLGEVLCDIRYSVTSVVTRDDCEDCQWAYDVVLGAAEILVDTECATIGYDAAAIAAIEGQTRGYGFATNYLGHADVLMTFDGSRWSSASFADWDEERLQLEYDWDQGYAEY